MLIVVLAAVLAVALLPVGYLFWKRNQRPKIMPAPPPPLIVRTADAREPFVLDTKRVTLSGKTIKVEEKGGVPNIGYWSTPGDYAAWTTTVAGAGEYDVELEYGFDPRGGGGAIVLACGDSKLTATLSPTSGWDSFTKTTIGRMYLPSGTVTVTLKPGTTKSRTLINLRAITFTPSVKRS
jgi:alpha-L-fucosidase